MNILTQNNNSQSITSQQIADMVGKRHDSVKRTIDYLVKDNAIQLPHHAEVKNHLGQAVGVYIFSGQQGRLDSITVVAQLSPTFTSALVKRWDELEQSVSQPVAPSIPQSYAEALQLAADQALQLEMAQPKIAHYDAVVERDGLLNATQVGQKVRMSAVMLNRVLDELGVYNQNIKRGRAFRQWFVDQGFGILKQTSQGHSQAMFTKRGEAWIIERLISEGVA